ncbi:helix-turn-helix domain-containing protein [Mycolicibacterium bacteremicum]|uniref:arsenate reductase/protein-tyrosine-phosphatase family protein n=1 Tax=Mycolicibacterium bacteremicum TaxID=564198 RepID=UPI0026F158E6|nr:helix-turn-helix domain-containing protein [Mycolicibacterium bacteremicum]
MIDLSCYAQRVAVHAALADPARLAIVDRLIIDDASPSELRVALGMPSNLMAHHLNVLESAGVMRRTRSEADRRRTYLRLNQDALAALIPAANRTAERVVFVCTQNSARSQMAAAIWNRHGVVPATSAGTHPAESIHPEALAAARRRQIPISTGKPQHLRDILADGDLVIAVCDNAHEELPQDLNRIHWSVPDPARSPTSDAFDTAFDELAERVNLFSTALRPA